MFKKNPPEVLVVGAGPVGLCAALALARNGVRTEIIDQAERRGEHSYALALHPKTLEVLKEFGLLDRVLEQSLLVRTMGLYDGKERRAEIDLTAGGTSAGLAVLPQNQVEQILENALKAEGVSVRWNHRLAYVEPAQDGALVAVNKLVMDGIGYGVAHTEYVVGRSDQFVVPFVVGADGHMSLVRRQLPVEFESVGVTDHFAVFEFESDYDFKNEVRLVLDDESTNVLWPLPDGHCRWSFELPRYRMGDDEREKDEANYEIVGPGRFPILTREFLENRLRKRAPWFRGSIGHIRWRILVRFERRLAASFGSQHTWLAGDAAHLAGPVGVQSMNIGLREAVELTTTLGDMLRGNTPRESLSEYNTNRLAEWRLLLGAGGSLKTDGKADPWVSSIADRLLPCLPASGDDLAQLVSQLHLELPQSKKVGVTAC